MATQQCGSAWPCTMGPECVHACGRVLATSTLPALVGGVVAAAVARRGVLSGTRSCGAEPEKRQAVHRDKEDVLKKIGRGRQEGERVFVERILPRLLEVVGRHHAIQLGRHLFLQPRRSDSAGHRRSGIARASTPARTAGRRPVSAHLIELHALTDVKVDLEGAYGETEEYVRPQIPQHLSLLRTGHEYQ